MGELWFVGVGLSDENDLSRRAWELLGRCGALFAEEHTSRLAAGSLERLSAALGRSVTTLSRSELESETPIREALARHERVALLVAGDPFVATTHVALRLSVESWGHRWGYLPNATVVTAVPGFLGLMQYRFGRTVSLPFPAPGFTPRSPLEHVARNRVAGLHTLVLLDLRPEEGRYLTANAAISLLTERDDRLPRTLAPELELAVVARVGRADAQAWVGRASQLLPIDFGPPLHSLVVPAPELHFLEQEAWERWRRPYPSSA